MDWLNRTALVAACLGLAVAAEGQGPASARDVTEIRLERDCFGCATGSVLVLRRNGEAALTATGKARHGTEDRLSHGRVRVADFDRLARLVVTEGFFTLQEEYSDPELQDGGWTSLAVFAGGLEKTVTVRHESGPPALKKIVAAVERIQATISFREP